LIIGKITDWREPDKYQGHEWRDMAGVFYLVNINKNGVHARMKSLSRKLGKAVAQRVFSYINTRPGFRLICINGARKFGLYEPLRSLYKKKFTGYLFTGQRHSLVMNPASNGAVSGESLVLLTPRGRRIYADLAAAIKKNRKTY
jgi:hypothetical protein